MKYTRIRNLREDKDLSQSALASMLNISQRAYSHYENGERSILCQLADIYNTSTDYILNRTNNKKSYPKNK